jgi:hypothetical protein
MKARRPDNHGNFESRRREKVVAIWRGLSEPEIGGEELRRIQQALGGDSGEAGVASPAAIARMLADEGAKLRHPEVIEYDAHWREAVIKSEVEVFSGLEDFAVDGPISRQQAEALINELERLRQRFVKEANREALADLTMFAANTRRAAQSFAKNRASDPARGAEQSEIAEWLKVWIQTPNLFADWLALRKRSAEFRERFGSGE